MDTCLAIDTNRKANAKQVALAVSNNNVYDGYIGDGFPTELTKTFIGIRKKDSNEVGGPNQLITPIMTDPAFAHFPD